MVKLINKDSNLVWTGWPESCWARSCLVWGSRFAHEQTF